MTRKNRRCKACHAACPPRYGIPDPCLGILPRVENACCGHGFRGHCYVVIVKTDGTGTYSLRGDRARDWQIRHGGNPAEFGEQQHDPAPGPLAGWERT